MTTDKSILKWENTAHITKMGIEGTVALASLAAAITTILIATKVIAGPTSLALIASPAGIAVLFIAAVYFAAQAYSSYQQMYKNEEISEAKTGAETAAQKAETAKTGAETAAQKAETAKTGAETAAQKAETAKTGAETAAQKAETAKNGVEGKVQDLATKTELADKADKTELADKLDSSRFNETLKSSLEKSTVVQAFIDKGFQKQ